MLKQKMINLMVNEINELKGLIIKGQYTVKEMQEIYSYLEGV